MTRPKTREDWEQRAAALSFRHQAFIDGHWVDAASGKTFDCTSPIDGRVLAKVAECGSVDVDRAVAAARRAFDAGAWANARPSHRKKVLVKFAQLVQDLKCVNPRARVGVKLVAEAGVGTGAPSR